MFNARSAGPDPPYPHSNPSGLCWTSLRGTFVTARPGLERVLRRQHVTSSVAGSNFTSAPIELPSLRGLGGVHLVGPEPDPLERRLHVERRGHRVDLAAVQGQVSADPAVLRFAVPAEP